MREYKAVKTYSFDDSYTILRKTTVLGITYYQQILEWSDFWGKYLPMLTSKSWADLTIKQIKNGGTTYKWETLDYRNRRLNPWKQPNNK